MTKFFEVNFDGLVGPTHNHSGLAFGNLASEKNKTLTANPKKAALQGLKKMKALSERGYKQALLPPHERPYLPELRKQGFTGTDAEVIEKAYKKSPQILARVCSAASMWTANAATMAPSVDTTDGRTHITAANLHNKAHRHLEGPFTARVLRKIFSDEDKFGVHDPLPLKESLGDEGAANHLRFSPSYGDKGLHVFVYGKSFTRDGLEPQKLPARQSLEASEDVARLNHIPKAQLAFVQQNPEMIDAGVFHNDVISVSNLGSLFYYDKAFVETKKAVTALSHQYETLSGKPLDLIEVSSQDVAIEDVVSSYLFNSQLLALDDGHLLVAPQECLEIPSIAAWIESHVADSQCSINEVVHFDLRQSMRNGGGPACLRQRVVLSEDEIAASHQGVYITDDLYNQLTAWVEKHYRDKLEIQDLADPKLLDESRRALDELSTILDLGSIYDFQKDILRAT